MLPHQYPYWNWNYWASGSCTSIKVQVKYVPVTSMYMHMYTISYSVQIQLLCMCSYVLCGSRTKCTMATFSLCSNVATGLLTGMTKNGPRFLKHTALSHPSFDNASPWPEALRSRFFVHTALQFRPILSLVVRTFSTSAKLSISTVRMRRWKRNGL